MLTLEPFSGLRFARIAPSFLPSDAVIANANAVPTTHPQLTLMQRFDRWLWRQEQKGREAYLAGATDRFDLERRIRHIDRGGAFWFG